MTPVRLPAAAVRHALTAARLALAAPVPPTVHRAAARATGRLTSVGGPAVERSLLGGVPGEWSRPADAVAGRAVLYLHGGGYAVGGPELYRGPLSRLTARLRAPAFAVAYRQAPEHPHPAALEDARAAYDALRERFDDVLVVGDSAGGGLTLALAMAIRDDHARGPSALGLVCPWLDLTAAGATQRTRPSRADRQDALLRPAMLERWARAYAQDRRDDPSASPLYGALTGLPPIVLHSAGDDLLLADAERLEALARTAGVRLTHRRHPGLWHDVHLLAGVLAEADAALDGLADDLLVALGATARPPRVAIVGAGVSGLVMGRTLRDHGLHDFTIYEKAEEVGGTWRENTYPGLTCDVPSAFYSFSFAPNPSWTSSFAPGGEIQEYVVATADRQGLRPHVAFGQDVTEATWEDGRWRLGSAAGDEHEADVLVTATGILHQPVLPDIAGLDDFGGACFHSARWDHAVPLDGARVGVVGNGSTGVQIVTALAGRTADLRVFQRTPQWVLPLPNVPYPAPLRWALGHVPGLDRAAYVVNQRALEAILAPAVARDGWQRRLLAGACRRNLESVRDPDLRERLRPDYEPLCKRLIMSAGFYPALQRPDVTLVDAGIDHVCAEGVVTADGTLHELDVLVLATGFDAHAYMRPMRITGRDGLTLDEAWADGPRGLNTVALPGFPNLFALMGPHSPVGNHSIIAVAESQAAYIAQCLEVLRDDPGVRALEPRAEAADAFNAAMRADIPGTVWATGCQSWYLGEDGVPQLWPWSPARHRALLARPDLDEFHRSTVPAASEAGVRA